MKCLIYVVSDFELILIETKGGLNIECIKT